MRVLPYNKKVTAPSSDRYIKINTSRITAGPAVPGVVVVKTNTKRQKLMIDVIVRILANISLITIHDYDQITLEEQTKVAKATSLYVHSSAYAAVFK